MKCKVCSRESFKDGYCDLHAEAYKSVVERYDAWKKALGISWKEYLSEIVKNPLTGEWSREVAEHLIKSGERESGAQS